MVASLAPTAMIMAGGTGGHVYPALAVALELRGRGYEIHWMGTEAGLEARVVPEAEIPLHTLRVRGIRGKGLGSRLAAIWALFGAIREAMRLLRSIRPGVVLGMGGYVAGPGGLASWLLRKPLVIHEQNSVAGTTNRILQRLARRVLCAYPHPFKSAVQVQQLGNPVREELLQRAQLYRAGEQSIQQYQGQRPMRLLVLGGSLGAQALNEAVPEALSLLAGEVKLEVRHQTGVKHIDAVRALYAPLADISVETLPYIEDMAEAYAWSDLVLCRAGALTVSELTIMGSPSVLVPLPHAIDNHQLHNAEWLVEQGGARLLNQADMTAQSLAACLGELAADPAALQAMSAAALAAASPDATGAVADVCEEVADGR